jgi:hypothetical protein
MGVRGSVWCSIVGLLAVAFACSTEYDRPPGSRPEQPASGGRAATGTGGSGGFPVVGNGGTTATGGRAPGEPPGDDVLTFVNGVVDAKSLLLCLTTGSGSAQTPFGSPFPEAGLAYGEALVLPDLSELELTEEDAFAAVVIAGELELVEGMDCEEAVATARAEQAAAPTTAEPGAGGMPGAGGEGGAGGESGSGEPALPLPAPPRLRVGTLPIVPAGALSAGRSSLLAAVGCIGGPAFATKEAPRACGNLFSADHPTLTAVLVRLSRRTAFGKLGLQALQASTATQEVEVRSAPLMQTSEFPFTFATRLGFGTISSDPPRLDFGASTYGVGSALWAVQVLEGGAVLYSESWEDLLERSRITVVDGQNYTLVYVGPHAGVAGRPLWNEPRVVAVENDPTLDQ